MSKLPNLSRISTKLTFMSTIGITLVLMMLLTSWLTSRMTSERSTFERQQLSISRDLVGAKASMRGMQIGVRDLRLAGAHDKIREAVSYIDERHNSLNQLLDMAISKMVSPINKERAQAIKDLAATYRLKAADMQRLAEAKIDGKAQGSDSAELEEKVRVEALATADNLAKIVDDGVAAATAQASKAEQSMIGTQNTALFLNFGVGTLVLATLCGSAIFGSRSIARPIERLTGRMSSLAEGDLDVDVPFADRRNEIGEMARAVEVFKINAVKVRDLNAQEAALQAENADLQLNIATVVSAAVDGDFSHRITKDYHNDDLNRFASSVNELVGSVDTGIAETRRVVSALAEGDLTHSMSGNFRGVFAELQHNVNSTMVSLRTVLGEVRAAIDTINGGAGEMRVASGDLSRRTEQQAASLEETSSALEEITAAVKNSTERALEASHMVDEARRSSEQSGAVVSNAVTAMHQIEQASREINQIISVIDEIAFQTNLLALNAGVEAARAGDAGKGFAVVAQEVRELAQRSANAAKDIKELISRSSEEVRSGVKLVTATGEALGLIESHVMKINEHVHSIATAAKEQSTGLHEVSTAVNHMDQVTQQNAAMVEESTAATNRLADEAISLARLISRFRLEGGATGPRDLIPDDKPVRSPARSLGRKLAGAFGGIKSTVDAWEEF